LSLCGEKVFDGQKYVFEMWVEVEGERAPIYDIGEGPTDCLKGSIMSERGKVRA
jgi:hypothetical protein